jgi:hypothetical protein
MKEARYAGFFLLLFVRALFCHAQASGPETRIGFSPQEPVVNTEWTLSVYVNYPAPEEVSPIAPVFPEALKLDRIIKRPWMQDLQEWTLIEYFFIPLDPGPATIGSFGILTPAGRADTVPLAINVQGVNNVRQPGLYWGRAPSLTAGKNGILHLYVRDGAFPLPGAETFMPALNPDMILESLAITPEERNSGLVLKLSVIPLKAGAVTFPPRTFTHGDTRYEIPGLRITVTAAQSAAHNATAPATQAFSPAQEIVPENAEFPVNNINANSSLPQKYTVALEGIYAQARDLWNGGLYAQAVAELRKNERDHPAGNFLRQLRLQAEETLGLYETYDESRAYRKFLSALAIALFALSLAIPVPVLIFFKNKNIMKAAVLCAIIMAGTGFFCLFRLLKPARVTGGAGITFETPVRLAPDETAEEVFRFQEGQPVRIISGGSLWIYAKAFDRRGISGWIPAKAVIYY